MPKKMNIPNVTHTDTDRLMTTRELAEMLKVSQNAIDRDRMIGGGVYPTFIRIGEKSIRYRLSTVNSWMNNQQEQVQTQPRQ